MITLFRSKQVHLPQQTSAPMSSVRTISSPSATGFTLTLPNNLQSRELAATWERQQQRRLISQNVLFTGRKTTPSSSSEPTTTSNGLLPCGNATPVHTTSSKIPLSARPPPMSPSISISADENETPFSDPAVQDYHIMSEILSGASTTQRVDSRQAFDLCMSLTDLQSNSSSCLNRRGTSFLLFLLFSTTSSRTKNIFGCRKMSREELYEGCSDQFLPPFQRNSAQSLS